MKIAWQDPRSRTKVYRDRSHRQATLLRAATATVCLESMDEPYMGLVCAPAALIRAHARGTAVLSPGGSYELVRSPLKQGETMTAPDAT
jgi:hypothetical protein